MTPLAALLVDWVITALWPLIGAEGLRHYSGTLFMASGLALGLVVMSPFLAARGRWRRLLARDAAPLLATMGLFSGTATVIYICALAYTTPVNAVIVAQIEVLYSIALTSWLLKERPSAAQACAGLLVMGGTALIAAHDLKTPRWTGDLMIVATAWMYQISHIAAKRLPPDLDAATLAGGRIVYGLLAMLPLCAANLLLGARWSWEPEAVRILFLQGLLMSSVNFVLWYVCIRGMELGKATIIMLSYPALTLVFSWLLGREPVRAAQLAGLACSFAGAAWAARLSLERARAGAVPSSRP